MTPPDPPRLKTRTTRCGHLSPTAEFGCSKRKGHRGPHSEKGVSETLSNKSGEWTDADCECCIICGCRVAERGLCGECACEQDGAIW